MNKRIVVTGGCGYIGSHVAKAFVQAGATVMIIDRVHRPHTLAGIDQFYELDFVDSLGVIREYQPHVIVHCAGTSLVGPSVLDPAEYYDNNIAKTIKLLNFVRDFKQKPLIMFSSSASVYGEPESVPIAESAKTNPISPYGNTKLMTESILQDYYTAYGITSICFRYFNAAGAALTHDLGQEPGATHIVARALEASINQTTFTINGNDFNTPDGTCIRDYVHVWDIAQAHIKGSDWMMNNPGASVFNLGTNAGVSNQQIADYVRTHYGLIDVQYGDKRPGDPATLISDATVARTKLNWEPVHSDISTIIDTAHKWYTR